MAHLKDYIAYIIKHYPEHMKNELSNARVTKMLYLADWHQAINHGRQITNIDWYFDNYGPYVKDIKNEAENNSSLFELASTANMFGRPKTTLRLKNHTYKPLLDQTEQDSLNHVIAQTQNMYWNDFIKLVYSTYPVTSSDRYSILNLVEKAKKYKELETI